MFCVSFFFHRLIKYSSASSKRYPLLFSIVKRFLQLFVRDRTIVFRLKLSLADVYITFAQKGNIAGQLPLGPEKLSARVQFLILNRNNFVKKIIIIIIWVHAYRYN